MTAVLADTWPWKQTFPDSAGLENKHLLPERAAGTWHLAVSCLHRGFQSKLLNDLAELATVSERLHLFCDRELITVLRLYKVTLCHGTPITADVMSS